MDELEHALARLEKQRQGWRVVVQPLVIVYILMELLSVNLPVAHIIDPVAFGILQVEELGYFVDVVSIQLFRPLAGRKAHSDNSIGDVTEIQVEVLGFVPPPLPRD